MKEKNKLVTIVKRLIKEELTNDKVASAYDILKKKNLINYQDSGDTTDMGILLSDAEDCMVEFATLHVQSALKKIIENVTLMEDGVDLKKNKYEIDAHDTFYKDTEITISMDSITESYPLSLIK